MLEERKLQKAKITVMRNAKFALLQGVMMVGKTYITDIVPTACTNGRDEHYGRAFVKKLSDKESSMLNMIPIQRQSPYASKLTKVESNYAGVTVIQT